MMSTIKKIDYKRVSKVQIKKPDVEMSRMRTTEVNTYDSQQWLSAQVLALQPDITLTLRFSGLCGAVIIEINPFYLIQAEMYKMVILQSTG